MSIDTVHPQKHATMPDNAIATQRNQLLILGEPAGDALQHLISHFCGTVVRTLPEPHTLDNTQLYVCGDLRLLDPELSTCRVIRELSSHIPEGLHEVGLGQVPLLIHNAGVLFRRFFKENDLFLRIQREHTFQHLTESTKRSRALRTGIYLTDIARELHADDREILHYRLLRCSSNLTGPTDNFRDTDRLIMDAINQAAAEVFEQQTDLNHVLAQIYENTVESGDTPRERKARISAHSDKTKDMREDGLIAFCTFYDPAGFEHLQPSSSDPFDWCYKKSSGLTRLHFKLKPGVEESGWLESFSVTLYPNSVFIIPLSTNRLYTHEIRPSVLNVDRLPTRMGYVARCSKAEAQFMDGQTYLKDKGALIPLEPMAQDTLTDLRDTYRQENKTANAVTYGKVHFSMNAGDYQKPIY